jgi:hypothetical protein
VSCELVAANADSAENGDLFRLVQRVMVLVRASYPTQPMLGFSALISATALLLAQTDADSAEIDDLLTGLPAQLKQAVESNRLLNMPQTGAA